MEKYIKIFWLVALALSLNACYEPLELNTDNISKVEVPLSIAMPLVDGKLTIEYDSIVDFSSFGDDVLTFENKKAYVTFDTVINFYDQLTELLDATDVDLSTITAFDQDFEMDFGVDPSMYPVNGTGVYDGVDQFVPLSVPDSFRSKYNANALFLDFDQPLKLEGIDYNKTMDLGLDFEVYRIDVQSGTIKIDFRSSEVPVISDDSLVVYPYFMHDDNGTQVKIEERAAFEILDPSGHLPAGVFLKSVLTIPAFRDSRDSIYVEEILLNTLDTTVIIDMSGLYFYSEDGNGAVTIDLKNSIEVPDVVEYVIFPMADTLGVNVEIDDLMFERAVFNYGLDTAIAGDREIEIDYLDELPEEVEFNGFRIGNPELKIKLRNNLGFAARLAVDKLGFVTDNGFENILTTGSTSIDVKAPVDPQDIRIKPESLVDSLVIDSTNARIDEIDVLSIKALQVEYAIIVNPDDLAGNDDAHNFFYKYAPEVEEDMYDVELEAEVRVPVKFSFGSIKYSSTIASPFEELDSMIEVSVGDSIALNVEIWTSGFPFELKTQFYFAENNASGDLVVLDSMFAKKATILPLSLPGDSVPTTWRMAIDAEKYESLKRTDSVTFEVDFSMRDEEFFELKQSDFCIIGYDFSIGKSTVMFENE